MRESLSDEARRNVHLVCLPMDDVEENAVIVNALQRNATVVVQKSIAEGFGLTVAEAMWKARPIVATEIGGIQDQVDDGETGVLLEEPRDLDAYGAAVRGLLEDPERARGWARRPSSACARVPRRAQPDRLPRADLPPAGLTLGEPPADEQRGPVGHARGEVAERAADQPGGEAGPHPAPRYRQGPHACRRLHHRHRAARVARPRRGRGARRRGREARRPGRQGARAQPARPRLPHRQGAAAGDHPARRPRGRARRGRARVARRLVLGRDRRRQGRPGRRARPRPRRAARRGRAAALLDRDRRAPRGEARRLQGPRGRPPRAGRRRRGDRRPRSRPLRERSAKLETTERAAANGDFVVMDFLGTLDGEPFAGGEGRDQMVELGSGRLVPGFEEQLEGASAGDERTVTIAFPDDYGAEDLAGREAEFAVTVKEVKAKDLPELDDDFAAEAGFDTLDELREDIRERLAEAETRADRGRVPRGGARRRRRRRDGRRARRAGRGPRARAVGPDGPLALAPGDPEGGLPADRRQDRGRDDRREPRAPSATCGARPCSPPSSRPRASSRPTRSCSRRSSAPPPPSSTTPKKLLERLRSSGRLDSLREELAQRKAIDLIADVRQADLGRAGAGAQEALDPGADAPDKAAASELWTPGS